MTEQKTRQQLKEEIDQLSQLQCKRRYSIPQELIKSFPNRQSEIHLRIMEDMGFYDSLTLIELPYEVIAMKVGHPFTNAKKGNVPKRKYEALWKKLEAENIWNLEDTISNELSEHPICSISVNKGQKRNSFFVRDLVDLTITRPNPYYRVIKGIKKFSKYARDKLDIDYIIKEVVKKHREIEGRKIEIWNHPCSIADRFRRRNNDSAIRFYEKSLEQNPNDYDAQYWLTLLYAQKGETNRALEQWQKFSQVANGIKEQRAWLSIAKDEIERFRK